MQGYPIILKNSPLENRDLWYHNWRILTAGNIAIGIILIPAVVFLVLIMENKMSTVSWPVLILSLLLPYYIFPLYAYFKERKIEGWRMNTRINALIASSPVFISLLLFVILFFIYQALHTTTPFLVLYIFMAVLMTVSHLAIIYDIIGGYRIERRIRRIHPIPDLKEELMNALKKAFPHSLEKWGFVRIGDIRSEKNYGDRGSS